MYSKFSGIHQVLVRIANREDLDQTATRALTLLFGNGAGAHGIGKISGVLTKIGKFYIVLMYDISIARLIPIIKLFNCTMRKGRERYSIIL